MADDTSAYVNSLYRSELGRAAEDAGLKYWSDQIASGALTREQVANAINQSAEGVRYDIGTTYQKELGRTGSVADIAAADPKGLQYWADAVTSGRMTLAEAQNAIARSQEGTAYDVGRVYNSELGRTGTFADISKTDPGAKYWQDQLMSGKISEAEFINAIRNSDEFLKRNATGSTSSLDKLKAELEAQKLALEKQKLEWEAQRKAQQAAQLQALQAKQTANAAQGQFQATAPLAQAGSGLASAGGMLPAPAPVASPIPAIAPAPQQMTVPQTYLTPAPPQYRNVNPFGMPFNNPFESYYGIATRRRAAFDPITGLPMDPNATPQTAPTAPMSPYAGYPFYTAPATAPAATAAAPVPTTTTPTT